MGVYNAKVGDDQIKLGDRQGAMASYAKGLEIYRGLMQQHPNPRYDRIVGLLYTRIGDAHLMDSQYAAAAGSYRQAIARAQKFVDADPQNVQVQSDLAVGFGLLGKTLGESGKIPQGLGLVRKAIAMMEGIVAHDPHDTDSKRILGLFYMWRGEIVAQSGNIDASLADHQRTASLLEAIHTAEPKDAEARVTLAETKVKIGSLLARQGNNTAAMERYRGALSDLEPFVHADPPNIEALYASADAYSSIGQLVRNQTAQEKDSARQAELWNVAHGWFEKSTDTWKKIPNPGRITPTGFKAGDPKLAMESLAVCDAALNRLSAPATPVTQ
jgi:tetratricopeptide (TPR) repeat protein